jgi:O-antigen ligase
VDAPVPLIVVALLAAAGLVAPTARGRAAAMVGALLLTPVLLVAHLWDNSAIHSLRDRPAVAAAAVVAGLAAVAALAVLFHRRPVLFPLAAVAMVPFRIPIATGGSTANLLVPLYLVLGAGVLAHAVPRLRSDEVPDEPGPGWLERVLAAAVVLYAVQATYSSDFAHALENVVFFYVPFTLLFTLLRRVAWTDRLAAQCLGILAALALVFVGIGFVEYATRSLLLNPKVISSNQFESYFRVNSLFFDPNIYGRFLALVMIALTALVLWRRNARDVWLSAGVLLWLLAGLVTSFSQSSIAALLLGLAVLAAYRWSVRWALYVAVALLVAAAIVLAASPAKLHFGLKGNGGSANNATTGRAKLIEGGLELFADRPLQGFGSGSFQTEYERHSKTTAQNATSASHTIPITVAAEQGIVGFALYVALLALAFLVLFRGAGRSPPRIAIAACFAALVLHTFAYADFLEDPLTWTLLGIGLALARAAEPQARDRAAPAGGEHPVAA